MPPTRESCPYLPKPDSKMSYRSLSELCGGNVEAFYLEALRYGHYLWLQGFSGRAILAVTRALYADIGEKAPVLGQSPLPYKALRWIIASHRGEDFPGNPRVSFQHQATRLRGEREDLRRARAWAVWALVRAAKPTLPADEAQGIEEPNLEEIEQRLTDYGHPGEFDIWIDALGC